MFKKIINRFLVRDNISIKNALNKMNKVHIGLLIVIDNKKKFKGVITEPDIRRAIISGHEINSSILKIFNSQPIFISYPIKKNDVFKIINRPNFSKRFPEYIPIIDKEGKVKDLTKTSNLFDYLRNKNTKILNTKRTLLIGGAGYIGSILTEDLLKMNYKVRVFDNFVYDIKVFDQLKKNKNLEIIKGDTRHIEKLSPAFKDVDTVVHLAELVGDPLCSLNPEKTYEINYLATNLIITLCKKFFIKKFIYISSCSVYGKNLSDKKLNEGSELNPLSIYAKLKLNCEEAIIENTDPFFKYYIFRLGTVFGLSHRPRFDLVINLFAGLASSKKKILVNGGNQWRPFVHVKDVSNAIIKAIKDKDKKNQKHIYNLISENCKIIDLGSKIKKIFKNAEIEVNQKEIDKRDYYVSDKKIQTKLKFKKKYSIEDGIVEIKNFIIKKKINIFNKKYHNFIFKK